MAQLQSSAVTGSLVVTGTLTAQEFHTEFVSSSILHESGSTSFGNSSDDVHNMTGSLNLLGDGNFTGTLTATSFSGAISLDFNDLNSKTSGTGEYSTSGYLTAGRGGGGVSLTTNDGGGNANVTFNHKDETPEQNGNSGRIEVNTDSTSGAYMSFELKSNVTGGSATSLTEVMKINEGNVTFQKDIYIPQYIYHLGNTNTRIRFQTNDINMQTNAQNVFRINGESTQKEIVVNDVGADYDFRVEGDTEANLLQVDAANDRVGINSSAPEAKLHINNGESWSAQDLGASSSGSVAFRVTGRSGATNDLIMSSNGTTNYTVQVVGDAATSGQLHLNPFGGNVGVGTSSPTATLHIADGATSSFTTLSANDRIKLSGDGVLTWGASANYGTLTWDTSKAIVSAQGSNRLHLATAGNADALVVNGANVGIGTTAPSDGDLGMNDPKLHVYGPATSGYHLVSRFQAGSDANDTGAAIAINHSNDRGLLIKAGRKDSDRPAAYFDLIDSNGSTTNLLTMGEYGSEFYSIFNGGNVGIGTASPNTLLHIFDSAASNTATTDLLKLEAYTADFGATPAAIALAFKFQDSNNLTNEARIRMATVNDTDYGDNDEAASNLIFSTTNGGTESDKMIITGRGNVGIGNTNPGYLLTVSGEIATDSYIRHNGDSDTYFGFSAANTYKVVAGGTERLSVAGDVNINNATDIQINGTSRRVNFNAGTGTIRTTTANNLYLESNSSTVLELKSNLVSEFYGKVGIGVGAPTSELHVSGSNDVLLVEGSGSTILDVQGSQGQLFSVTDDLTGTLFAASDISGVPVFLVSGSGVSYFDGDLGIGTTSPGGKLDVRGNAIISGSLKVTGSAFFNGNIGNSPAENPGVHLGISAGNDGQIQIIGTSAHIDFSNAGSEDYDARIILEGNDELNIAGVGNNFQVNGNRVLTTADEGSGNGIDADTVDGIQSSRIIYGSNVSGTNEKTVTNWNSVDKSGFYSDDNASNSWTTGWTSIINHRLYDDDNNYHSQIGFGTYGSEMYYRGKHGAVDGWSSWQRIFMDDYHPNANAWTTARTITLAGDLTGNVSIDGSANVTLTATVANNSHTHDDRYYTETEVNEGLSHLRGWVSGYGSGVDSNTRWNFTEDALEIQSSADTSVGAVYQARRIENGETVRFTIMVKGSAAASNGLYLRLYQHDGDMPNGKTHVSNDAQGTYVQEDDRGDTTWYENGAITTGWVTFEREYTAPADGYISLVVLNWTGIGTNSVYLKTPDIQTIQAANSNKLDGLDSSQFLRSDASDTMSGVLTINHTNDNQLLLTSPSSWTGIGFNDSAATGTQYIWHNGGNGTFAIGGGGSNVSGKKLHIHGGTTIGANIAASSTPSNGLLVEGNAGIGNLTATNAVLTVKNTLSMGIPGNGTNANGRFISIEGNTDASGEGSGRVFFTEHNSTTAAMDAYGMSIGYRGGAATVTGASGNDWTGLSAINNGQWGMWGHNNSADGALIMYGDRAATFVNFAGNNVSGVADLYIDDQIISTGDTNTYFQFHAADQARIVCAGAEVMEWGNNYAKLNDSDTLRLGAGSDFRMWHDGTNHYFRNYHHAGGNMYWTGENTAGTNQALIYMITDVAATYVKMYANGAERFRTIDGGATVFGRIELDDSNTKLLKGTNNALNITTNSGNVTIGPQNTSWCHMETDRGGFYWNKKLIVNGGTIGSYDEDLNLIRANSTNDKIIIRGTSIGFYLDGVEDMRLENDGDLHVESDIIAYSSTISDSRLKDDVITIGGALDKVKKLRGVEYTWNKGSRKDQRDLGVIAQEVEKVIPEIVREKKMPLMDDSDTKYKTVDYEKLTAVLIEGMKEQQEQIEALKARIDELENK